MRLLESSQYDEIIVRLAPKSTSISEESSQRSKGSSGEGLRTYFAFVYSALPELQESNAQSPPNQPETLGGLPLARIEHLVVRWGRYQEYLAAFLEGTKDPDRFANKLLETISPGLQQLFRSRPGATRPLRIWWSSQTPELDDLPWELVAYADRVTYKAPESERLFFVRGLPPETITPLLPLEQKRLRLAVIGGPETPPNMLANALSIKSAGLRVKFLNEPPRQALRHAVAEGYELVHIVADGIVSLAYEGMLYLGEKEEPLTARELSSTLRGSRVTVLSFTPPDNMSEPDTILVSGYSVPSAYRAFAYLGTSILPLPTVVALLGPVIPTLAESFWRSFYTNLAKSLAIDEAIARGLETASGTLPVAVFLHHSHGHLFRLRPPSVINVSDTMDANPLETYSLLQASRDTVDRIESIAANYSQYDFLPPSVNEYLNQERSNQASLESSLDSWAQLEGEER